MNFALLIAPVARSEQNKPISLSHYYEKVVSAARGYFRDKLDNGTIRMLAAFPGSLDATCHLPLSLSLPTETKCGKNVTNAGRGEKECRGRGQRKHLSLLAASIHSVRIEIRWDEQISFWRRHQRFLLIFHDRTGAGALCLFTPGPKFFLARI